MSWSDAHLSDGQVRIHFINCASHRGDEGRGGSDDRSHDIVHDGDVWSNQRLARNIGSASDRHRLEQLARSGRSRRVTSSAYSRPRRRSSSQGGVRNFEFGGKLERTRLPMGSWPGKYASAMTLFTTMFGFTAIDVGACEAASAQQWHAHDVGVAAGDRTESRRSHGSVRSKSSPSTISPLPQQRPRQRQTGATSMRQ